MYRNIMRKTKRGAIMAIKTFDKVYTKDHGLSNEITCPVCSVRTAVKLFENTDVSPTAMFLKKDLHTFFAVCPKCASVFSVNPDYMKAKLDGTTCLMTESDLTVTVKGNA